MSKPDFQKLPSIDKLIQSPELEPWNEKISHHVRVQLARRVVSSARDHIQNKKKVSLESITQSLKAEYVRISELGVKKVINATGVVLHTNLGRAPLGETLLDALKAKLSGYCDLEMNLKTGGRGQRGDRVEELVSLLTGTDRAAVVNNCAAAMFLILHALGREKVAIVSRGELVQIGGGFRVPDIMEAAGVKLAEIGTTNMTSLKDYQKALTKYPKALVLKIHQSNFSQVGHTESVSTSQLAKVAAKAKATFLVDLGSGAMDGAPPNEPRVEEAVHAGADVICFSGDKLLGGTQAGFIVGKEKLVTTVKKSPLYRALRLDKIQLFLLEETLHLAIRKQKTLTKMLIDLSPTELKSRAVALQSGLQALGIVTELVPLKSSIGGGTAPGEGLEGWGLEINGATSEIIYLRLLSQNPPVVALQAKQKLRFDVRTILSGEEREFCLSLAKAVQG